MRRESGVRRGKSQSPSCREGSRRIIVRGDELMIEDRPALGEVPEIEGSAPAGCVIGGLHF